MNPVRALRCYLLSKQIDRALERRKQARLNGETFVSSYTRRRAG